jgi:hypothetical protein
MVLPPQRRCPEKRGMLNPNRIQRRLGHQSPADYEQHSAA